AAVTAVARATAQGASIAPGTAGASVVVADTTLSTDGAGNSVAVTNTGKRLARALVVETSLPSGSTPTGVDPRCGAPAEAGGKVVCVVDELTAGVGVTLFSWTGSSG